MECTNTAIKELLLQYGQGSLGREEHTRVEQHLIGCEDCREELALLRLAAAEEVPDPGDAFWAGLPDRIYREVRQQKAPERGTIGQVFAFFWESIALRPVRVSASVVAAVLVVSLFVVGTRRQEPVAVSAGDEYVYDDPAGPDAAFSAPLPNVAELTPTELDAAAAWAGKELSSMALEAETVRGTLSESDLSEELSELNSHELARLSAMLEALKKKEEQS